MKAIGEDKGSTEYLGYKMWIVAKHHIEHSGDAPCTQQGGISLDPEELYFLIYLYFRRRFSKLVLGG